MPNQWVEKPKLCFVEEKKYELWELGFKFGFENDEWVISFIFIHVFHNLKFELANYWWTDYFSDQKNMGTLNINVAVISV